MVDEADNRGGERTDAGPSRAELPLADTTPPAPLQRTTDFVAEMAKTTAGPAASADARTGSQLGRFKIVEVLGRGSFGIVYCAFDTQLHRQVALKILHSDAQDHEAIVQRFLREARAAAQLRHPHIVAVHEAGQIERCYFIASDLIHGGTLREAMAGKQQWPASEAASLVAALADALAYAHDRGIVHRDVKPENILLDAAGEPHLADFGLARQDEADGLRTQEGSAFGTPAYMSPEQALGEVQRIDGRSDQWSLGVLLYELLTGVRPFRAARLPEMVTAITQHQPISPRRHQTHVPRDIETICLKCLEKDPSRRYATCHALAEDLRRWQRGEPIHARPTGLAERAVRWCRRKPALASALAAALLASLAATGLVAHHLTFRTSAERELDQERSRADAEYLNTQRQECSRLLAQGIDDCQSGDLDRGLLNLAAALPYAERSQAKDLERVARINLAAWLPQSASLQQVGIQLSSKDKGTMLPLVAAKFDPQAKHILAGSRFAYVMDVSHGRLIHNTGRTFSSLSTLTWGPGEDHFCLISRDGIAECHKVDTRPPVRQIHASAGKELVASAFSRDGRLLLACCNDGKARLWELDTGRLRAELPHGERLLRGTFSPGGKVAATCGTNGVKLWNTTTGESTGPDLSSISAALDVQFTEDGSGLLVCSNVVQLYDLKTGAVVGSPHDFSQTLTGWHDEPAVAVSTDSKLAVRKKLLNEVQLISLLTGQSVGPPLKHSASVDRLRFSPDGRILATGTRDGIVRLWSAETGESIAQPLRHPDGWVKALDLHWDGRTLLTGTQEGPVRVWRLPGLASGMEETRLNTPTQPRHAVFHGRQLVTMQSQGKRVWLESWDLRNGKSLGQFELPGPFVSAAISPDGTKLAGTVRQQDAEGLGYAILQWSLSTAEKLNTVLLSEHLDPLVQYSLDGALLLVNSKSGKSDVFSSDHGVRAELALPPDLTPVRLLDGSRLLALNRRKELGLYTLGSDQAVGPPIRQEYSANAYAENERRTIFAVANSSNVVRAMSSEAGASIGPSIELPADVKRMAISASGSLLAVYDANERLRFWDVATGFPLGPVITRSGMPLFALDLKFAGDDQLVVACSDRAVRTIPVPKPAEENAAELLRKIETRTGATLGADGKLVMLNRPQWYERRTSEQPAASTASHSAGRMAPSLAGAKLLYEDTFDDPDSGFRKLENKQPGSSSYYWDGRFVIRSEKRNYATRSSRWTVKDIACRVKARTLGRPDDHFSLVLTNDSVPQEVGLRVHLFASGSLSVEFAEGDNVRTIGPLAASARPAPQFNDLLFVLRGDRIAIYVNGDQVGDTIKLPEPMPASRLYLAGKTTLAGQSEFEEIQVWDAASLPEF